MAQYVEHCHHQERNHQGIQNELIAGAPRDQDRWPDLLASAPRRAAQLLRLRGVVKGADEFDGSADESHIT
jgi:hypothetical protein